MYILNEKSEFIKFVLKHLYIVHDNCVLSTYINLKRLHLFHYCDILFLGLNVAIR